MPEREHNETAELTEQLEEKPESIGQRRDLLRVLDLMQKRVIVKLHIEMPSFQAKIKTEHLGLETILAITSPFQNLSSVW